MIPASVWAYYHDGQTDGDNHPVLSRTQLTDNRMREEPWTEVPLFAHPALAQLVKAAQDVLDSISFDDNGAMIGGKWMGGNGGLLSVETRAKTDALRRAISTISGKL